MNFLVVLTSGEKLWRQKGENVNLYVTTTYNFGLTIKKMHKRNDAIVANCSMIIFWTSHLDLSRSFRSKKVKAGQRTLEQFSFSDPKNNFGQFFGGLILSSRYWFLSEMWFWTKLKSYIRVWTKGKILLVNFSRKNKKCFFQTQ